jgi:hypothetical protein
MTSTNRPWVWRLPSWTPFAALAVAGIIGGFAAKGCTRMALARELEPMVAAPSSGTLERLRGNAAGFAIGHKRYVRTEEVRGLEALVTASPTQAHLEKLAKAYLEVGDFARASRIYYRLADYFKGRDDMNSSLAEIRTAQAYETKAGIHMVAGTLSEAELDANDTHARLEPRYGCYTGAFIDHEVSLPKHTMDGSLRRDIVAFNQRTGVHHASFFIYLGYGKPFPKQWVENLKKNGAMAQIAFEPTSYDQVQDDHYLRQFARDAKASGVPIFLRFASEMNGDWVAYHPSPERYVAMFRLVSKVMHEETENVAMVWCPFEIPQRYIEPYYPGKDAVDWVGVNIYSVLYNDNDPGRNAQQRNPADALKFIYKTYSKDHPIMIGEFGAANKSSLDMVARSDYAIMKMRQFYSCLPLLYPRVKAVHWLSMNAIQHADPGRQLNDYSLLEDADITEAYKEVNASPYFLKEYQPRAVSTVSYRKPTDGDTVSGKVRFEGWIKTYTNTPTAVWLVDGKEVFRSSSPAEYGFDWDSASHPNGDANLELVVIDRQGFEVTRRSVNLKVAN